MGTEENAIAAVASLLSQLRVVDLAPRLEAGIPNWPLHPPLIIDKARLAERDGYYCQYLLISEHTGAHVDAPVHRHPDLAERTIDVVPADFLVAPAVLYDFADLNLQAGELLTRAQVEAYERDKAVAVGPGEIALVNFGWMRRFWRTDARSTWCVTNSPGIEEEAVILFKERGIRAIGCDTVACEIANIDGREASGQSGHLRHWLPNNILIIEMLTNLEQLSLKSLFVATPLKIREGSGSPIRPVAFCTA